MQLGVDIRRRLSFGLFFCLLPILLWGGGCGHRGQPQLLVGAASSLTNVLQDLEVLWEQTNPDFTVQFHFAASGQLQRQLAQQAPLDLVFLAAQEPMYDLVEQGAVDPQTIQEIVGNRLVLIQPTGAAPMSDWQELRSRHIQHLAVGDFQTVPAGSYAKAFLESTGLRPDVESKLVFARNVRQVLAFVAAGNADAGIVYSTDLQGTDAVQVVATLPEESYPSIAYPAGISTKSAHSEQAQIWLQFLTSPAAQDQFRRHGFQLTQDE